MGMAQEYHSGNVVVAGAASGEEVLRDLGYWEPYSPHSPPDGLKLLGHRRLFFGFDLEVSAASTPPLLADPRWGMNVNTDAPRDDLSREEWTQAMGQFLGSLHSHRGVDEWMLTTDYMHVVAYYVGGVAFVNSCVDEPILAFRESFAVEAMRVFENAGDDVTLVDLGGTYGE